MAQEHNHNVFDKTREHLANERTFLAWIRTSIALMGLGFVLVKFTIFLKQVSSLLASQGLPSKGYSSFAGIVMIALGVVVSLSAYIQYRKHKKEIDNHSYYSSSTLLLFITLMLVFGGVILIAYLISII